MDFLIGEETIDKTVDAIRDMLYSYLPSMNRAFVDADELAVTMGFGVRPHKDGVIVSYKVAFVESKVKDGDSIIVNEKQQSLPFAGVTSVELKTGDRVVKLK